MALIPGSPSPCRAKNPPSGARPRTRTGPDGGPVRPDGGTASDGFTPRPTAPTALGHAGAVAAAAESAAPLPDRQGRLASRRTIAGPGPPRVARRRDDHLTGPSQRQEHRRSGARDAAMAERCTALGHRSPSSHAVLPHTLRLLRLQYRLFQQCRQSHPRRRAGSLTVPQIACALAVPVHWLADPMHRGTIAVTKDPTTGLPVFPDRPQTLKWFKEPKAGKRRNIRFRADPLSGSRALDASAEGL
jgi:hypothetical protein